MEYLQYKRQLILPLLFLSFKPCYKWNTFNTLKLFLGNTRVVIVLNLVINGIPSIPLFKSINILSAIISFKPCYKWNTFNTFLLTELKFFPPNVLNLVINGIPSILSAILFLRCSYIICFKPCYKWNTFNTLNDNFTGVFYETLF